VVAVLDGGPDDAEVVEVALAACVRLGSELRVVHLCGPAGSAPTPLASAYAAAYVSGALAVAGLVPGVRASAICLGRSNGAALRRELAPAELVVVATGAQDAVADAAAAPLTGLSRRVTAVPPPPAGPGRLRLGYRLALVRELERAHERRDGSTTPEELDDAWHVGVACPPLHTDTIAAWTACSTWPAHTGPRGSARSGHT
jgi:hypothetical protein